MCVYINYAYYPLLEVEVNASGYWTFQFADSHPNLDFNRINRLEFKIDNVVYVANGKLVAFKINKCVTPDEVIVEECWFKYKLERE